MSSTSVLAAIVDYLQPSTSQLPFLGNVYPMPPKFLNEGAFYDGALPGATTGVILWAWLGRRYSERKNLVGGAPGGKMRYYDLELQTVMLSTHKQSQDVTADNNSFLDALVTYIEESKTAGTGPADNPDNVIFQWGEGTTVMGTDLVMTPGLPIAVRAGIMHVYTAMTVKVCEYVSVGS